MTNSESVSKIICGSDLYHHQPEDVCYYLRRGGRLVYDGNVFRCCLRDHCYRVTPRTGRLSKCAVQVYNVKTHCYEPKMDKLKQSIIHKQIKRLKEHPETLPVFHLVKRDNRVWADTGGDRLLDPREFSQWWWMIKWKRDFKS